MSGRLNELPLEELVKPFLAGEAREYTAGHKSQILFSGEAPLSGVSIYYMTEMPEPAVHKENELLYVLEGTGLLDLEGQETEIRKDMAILVPKGKKHAICSQNCDSRLSDSRYVKVFWARFA